LNRPHSYIFSPFYAVLSLFTCSFVASAADVAQLNATPRVVDAAAYPHVARWAKHIQSYSAFQLAALLCKCGAGCNCPAKRGGACNCGSAAPAAAAKPADDDDDMFGDEDEDEEAARELEKAKIAAAHQAKKGPKKEVIAKSTVVFDVKPFEAETDMAELEKQVRAIVMEGLLWGSSKLADVAYGVKKLVITTVVEDDKVSIDDLQEAMCNLAEGELVQSTEIVAFNKI
jgi:elongation factor 1-beta